MRPYPFHYFHRVSYSDCTVGNHVYYAKYLEIVERARGELFRSIQQPLSEFQAAGVMFPASECRVKFLAPARYEDWLKVELALSAPPKARLPFCFRISNPAGQILAEGEVWHFAAGIDDERPRRIPERLWTALQPFVLRAEESPRPSP